MMEKKEQIEKILLHLDKEYGFSSMEEFISRDELVHPDYTFQENLEAAVEKLKSLANEYMEDVGDRMTEDAFNRLMKEIEEDTLKQYNLND